MDFVNLSGWRVLAVQENDHDYRVVAEYTVSPTTCPGCHCLFPNFKRFGVRERLFMDLPVHGKRVGIALKRQRYRCRDCGLVCPQPLPDIDDDHRATRRLVEHIRRESLRHTFVDVGESVGLSEGAVRLIFHEYVQILDQQVHFETPEWLGIDEIHILRKPRGILANLAECTILDLLANRNKTTIAASLVRLPNRERVRYVCMDMWQPYKQAVAGALPQATIIIDKFHVVRIANQCLDAVRKHIRAALTDSQRRTLMHDRFILLRRAADLDAHQRTVLHVWTDRFPLLGQAYDLKEQFFGIWDDATDRVDAEKQYDEWQDSIPDELESAFKALTTAVRDWRAEIFAYFAVPGARKITNAGTEAINGLVKLVNRQGRGYSFDAIRAKMLYSEGIHKFRKPKYARKSSDWTPPRFAEMRVRIMAPEPVQQPIEPSTPVNLGADIATISRKIEAGEF